MKLRHAIGLAVVGSMLASAGFLGCGGDDSKGTTGGNDAGVKNDASGGTDSGGGTDGGNEGGAALTCASYCNIIGANCNAGVTKEYTDNDTCMHMCAAMTPGTLSDTTGDTLGCRLGFAQKAAAAPATNCKIAGPTGGDTCGSHCEDWCKLQIARCGTTPFANQAACTAACANYAVLADAGDTTQTAGNSFNCRVYHLEAAYANDAAAPAHCPHAAPNGGPCQ